jgi:UDP-glucuronate 4-epimerase
VDSPISVYAATKKYNELLAQTYHHLYGIQTTGLRFFSVYGPWGRPDMALYKFSDAIVQGKRIDVYNFGKMKRDFTYITDIVLGLLSAMEKDFPCEIFNLGNSSMVELNYFITLIEGELGKKAKINLLPIQPGDVPESFADIAKAKRHLGFEPKVKIEEGVKEFIKWYRTYHQV